MTDFTPGDSVTGMRAPIRQKHSLTRTVQFTGTVHQVLEANGKVLVCVRDERGRMLPLMRPEWLTLA
jgi:hypothetical protein